MFQFTYILNQEVFNMNIWHDMDSSKVTPELFTAVVEIPKGSNCKYELDKKTGLIKLDRLLYTATHYPANYGFIPLTFAQDNDPLDVLVLCDEPLVPLCEVEARPIGMVRMVDQGYIDEKIVAVCTGDPFYSHFEDIKELPSFVGNEIRHFFRVYKNLEGKVTQVTAIKGKEDAIKTIHNSMLAYKDYREGKFKAYKPAFQEGEPITEKVAERIL